MHTQGFYTLNYFNVAESGIVRRGPTHREGHQGQKTSGKLETISFMASFNRRY